MFYSKKLKKLNGIKHCFFSKNGGYSKGLYKSLNCGIGSKDNKKSVSKNLKLVSKKLKIKNNKLILMRQTHSNKVVVIKKHNLKKRINSDAIITKIKGIGLAVLTADCVPILIYDYKNKVVGCIHAGWRGAFKDIIKNTIIRMKKLNANSKIYACVGPCLGAESYEVDLSFFNKFLKKSKRNKKYFSKKNKYKKFFNLRKFVANKLLELNVEIDHVNRNTYKEKNNFFSYRRSLWLNQTDYGRCISVIKLD